MKTSLLGMVGIVSVTLTLSGCSTATPIVSEWRNPAYAAGPFKRIMVGGPSGETSVRRTFEDEFVVQLRAAGIDALASYRYIPEDEGIDENNLKQAAQKARADAVLFPRSVKMEAEDQLRPDISVSFVRYLRLKRRRFLVWTLRRAQRLTLQGIYLGGHAVRRRQERIGLDRHHQDDRLGKRANGD